MSNKCTASHLKLPQHKTPAFILGNGISRLTANLDTLKTYGTIYGCNALYREFTPDYLIAVDAKMVKEIVDSGYNTTNSVWTNPNHGVKDLKNLNFFKPHKGWSSGPTALWFASNNGHRDIYILGFDYQGIKGKVNNVYASTKNYKDADQPATFFGNWSSQTEKVIKEFSTISYTRVVGDTEFTPPNLKDHPKNFKQITYTEFEEIFAGGTYKSKTNQKTTI